MFTFHSELRGLVPASHNCIITKWFFDSVFIDFYNLNLLLEHEKEKKFITEQKLEFFFNYLYVCIFTRGYPYTSTVIQKMRSSARHNLIYLCSTHGHKQAVSAELLHFFLATWLIREILLCMPVIQYFLDKRFNHTMMASSFPMPVLVLGFCFLSGSNFTSWKGNM